MYDFFWDTVYKYQLLNNVSPSFNDTQTQTDSLKISGATQTFYSPSYLLIDVLTDLFIAFQKCVTTSLETSGVIFFAHFTPSRQPINNFRAVPE